MADKEIKFTDKELQRLYDAIFDEHDEKFASRVHTECEPFIDKEKAFYSTQNGLKRALSCATQSIGGDLLDLAKCYKDRGTPPDKDELEEFREIYNLFNEIRTIEENMCNRKMVLVPAYYFGVAGLIINAALKKWGENVVFATEGEKGISVDMKDIVNTWEKNLYRSELYFGDITQKEFFDRIRKLNEDAEED